MRPHPRSAHQAQRLSQRNQATNIALIYLFNFPVEIIHLESYIHWNEARGRLAEKALHAKTKFKLTPTFLRNHGGERRNFLCSLMAVTEADIRQRDTLNSLAS